MSKLALVGRPIVTYLRQRRLEKLLAAGLPEQTEKPLRFLSGDRRRDAAAEDVMRKAEAIRERIAAHGDEKVEILYSPTPQTSGTEVSPDARPAPGAVLEFTMAQAARTGKAAPGATFLYLLAREFRCKTIVELGACVGISGRYLSASPYCERFITVEGSPGLAAIARESLREMSNATVLNMLFDDAIDQLLPELEEGIDMAFIDGHHEKVATIHYFQRLKPRLNRGALVVFDDIRWSTDMNEAWRSLANEKGFAHAIDCGKVGVCIWDPEHVGAPIYWNLEPVYGRMKIGNPHGWQATPA